MARKLVTVLLLVTFPLALLGCATTGPNGAPSPGGSAAAGAVGGAILGSAIGALCGLIPGGGIASAVARGAIAGAAGGALAGAIGGFAYGKYQEKLYRDRQAAETFHQYKPEEGEKVLVEVVEVTPESCVQGDNVALKSTFSVLTGNSEPVPVEVMQMVTVQDKPCGKPFCNKTDRLSGTYVLDLPMQIPGNAPEGKYKLVTMVKTEKSNDTKVCEFVVAKKAAPPAEKETTEQPEGTPAPEGKPAEEKPAA